MTFHLLFQIGHSDHQRIRPGSIHTAEAAEQEMAGKETPMTPLTSPHDETGMHVICGR